MGFQMGLDWADHEPINSSQGSGSFGTISVEIHDPHSAIKHFDQVKDYGFCGPNVEFYIGCGGRV